MVRPRKQEDHDAAAAADPAVRGGGQAPGDGAGLGGASRAARGPARRRGVTSLLVAGAVLLAGATAVLQRGDDTSPREGKASGAPSSGAPSGGPQADGSPSTGPEASGSPSGGPQASGSPSGGPPASGSQAGGSKLTWSPPTLSAPVTHHVSGDGPGTLTAEPGQDSIVVFDGPVHRRIRMEGGRHWVLRGGEILNDKKWSDKDDQSGLEFAHVTGTAFVEGLLMHGKRGKDGIRIADGGSDTTLIVQNSRIMQRKAGKSKYHADVIQAFGGVEALKVDHLTGSGDYQGHMWKQEPDTRFGPTDFRHVNFRATAKAHEAMINFVMSSPTGPVTLTEVYNEPARSFADGDFCRAQTPSQSAQCATDDAGRAYVTWSDTPIDIEGRVTQGPPPGGDFVPDGVAGMDYASPGYR